jgi:LPXTG-site transpeptidase (sortase) family protein
VSAVASDSKSGTPSSSQPQGSGIPVAISIPDVNISLGIKPGYYNAITKKWTLSSDSAFFAMMSVKPNLVSGNTYIYGHNRASVFNRLGKVHVGSLVTIKTDSGATFTYRYNHQIVANPNDSTVLSFDGAPRLTLQTCSGVFFQNRSLYVFDLVGVSHA